jgi:predicted dehydrogenase
LVKGGLIIGLGNIGMEYDYDIDIEVDSRVITHAMAFSTHNEFELLGAVDPSSLKRLRFTNKFKKPAFANIKEALNNLSPQIIVIASPTKYHKVILEDVLKMYKPIAIICEKPLSYDINEARLMIKLCEQSQVKLFVNYMRRSDLGVIEVKDRIKKGLICGLIKGVVWYSKGFIHNGSHLFNLLEFWLGDYKSSKIISKGRLWNGQDPEPDLLVEFELGSITFLAAWEEFFSHYSIELLAQSGRLRYEKGGEHITWENIYNDPLFDGYNILKDPPEIIPNSMNRYQWNVLDNLSRAMVGKDASICTGREALKTLEYMTKIINKI